jgi:hypothetical protein
MLTLHNTYQDNEIEQTKKRVKAFFYHLENSFKTEFNTISPET